jgi:hypothetical protein
MRSSSVICEKVSALYEESMNDSIAGAGAPQCSGDA